MQAFGNRSRRDRVLLGTRAWHEREGSDNLQARLKELMPDRVRRQLDEHNSTSSWRDFENNEIDAITSVNKGKGTALARAGNKKLDPETKRSRDEIKNAKDSGILRKLREEKEGDDEQQDGQTSNSAPNGDQYDQDDSSFSGVSSNDEAANTPDKGDWTNEPTLLEPHPEGETTFVQEADVARTSKSPKPLQDGSSPTDRSQVAAAEEDLRFSPDPANLRMFDALLEDYPAGYLGMPADDPRFQNTVLGGNSVAAALREHENAFDQFTNMPPSSPTRIAAPDVGKPEDVDDEELEAMFNMASA